MAAASVNLDPDPSTLAGTPHCSHGVFSKGGRSGTGE